MKITLKKESQIKPLKIILPIAIFIILVAIDQITKAIVVEKLMPIRTYPLIDGLMSLTYVENRGAGFGILQGARWFFVVGTVIVFAGIIYYYIKLPAQRPYNFIRACLVLISAGAFGNWIDRLLNGYVVDFFQTTFIDFPVFNMADIYVSVGTFFLAVIFLFFLKEEKKPEEPEENKPEELTETTGETV